MYVFRSMSEIINPKYIHTNKALHKYWIHIHLWTLKIQSQKKKKEWKNGKQLDNTRSVLIYLQKVSKVNPKHKLEEPKSQVVVIVQWKNLKLWYSSAILFVINYIAESSMLD